MKHQAEGVEFALKNNGICAFYYEVGCGKTLTSLATFQILRLRDPSLKLIVICPLSLIHGAWIPEIEKFTNFSYIDFRNKKRPRGFQKRDIFIINFEFLMGAQKFNDLLVFIQQSGSNWMCVIDESSKMKNHKAKTTERIIGWKYRKVEYKGIKDICKYRIILSGTPAPNIEWEYWAQMFFLNPKMLDPDFYRFKNICFELSRGKEIAPGKFFNKASLRKLHEQGFKYEIIPQRRVEMFERMKPWCNMVKAKDCLDLPESIDEPPRILDMTSFQSQVYNQMLKTYVAELNAGGDVAIANIVLTKLMKLRQITSGFIINSEGVETPVASPNPKLKALMDVIQECGNEQIIVWCQFHWEMNMLNEELSKLAGVSLMHGQVPNKDRKGHLDNFLNGKNRFLVAHPKSAAHGLTLTNCHFAVFFSKNYSAEEYIQARGRIYRKGQRNNCIYFHLICRDNGKETIDDDVLKIVQGKESRQDVAGRYLNRFKAGA